MIPEPALPAPAGTQFVGSFAELLDTPFRGDVNALCWPRSLPGDFGEIVGRAGPGEGIVPLDESALNALSLGAAGRIAREIVLADLDLLRRHGLSPELNCIHAYPSDDQSAVVATDVFSFHADSAPVETTTWLCTYHGDPSEGLHHQAVVRRAEVPATRAALLQEYGGADDEGFGDFLEANCYNLHYAPKPGARPYSFGVGHLWRIAVDWPGSPVPPCVHRAPVTRPGQPRLLLIS